MNKRKFDFVIHFIIAYSHLLNFLTTSMQPPCNQKQRRRRQKKILKCTFSFLCFPAGLLALSCFSGDARPSDSEKRRGSESPGTADRTLRPAVHDDGVQEMQLNTVDRDTSTAAHLGSI